MRIEIEGSAINPRLRIIEADDSSAEAILLKYFEAEALKRGLGIVPLTGNSALINFSIELKE